MHKGSFSEIFGAYNATLVNLNEARTVFQNELYELNELIMDHLQDACRRAPDKGQIKKFRWARPEESSSPKELSWTSFVAGAFLRLDILQPGHKRFRKAAAYVYFETKYDKEFNRFMFQCRFENQNNVNKNIDEKIVELLEGKKQELKNSYQIKSNTSVIFREELENILFENINDLIDNSLQVIETAVDILLPDVEYGKINEEEIEEDND